MPKLGEQTWQFSLAPSVLSTGTVAGKVEGEGPLGKYFDVRHSDDRMNFDSWEHAEQALFAQAANQAISKAHVLPEQVDLLIGGDLNAQLTSFYLGLRALPIPALGVYSACASICESMAVAAMAIESKMATKVLAGTSSHYCAAERQFRFPTEYGVQKPETAQRTVTGSGVVLLGSQSGVISITHATIGRIVDMGVTSPWEMGAAMAPAAADTISSHLRDTARTLDDYDCVATGDLGHIGHAILRDLLVERGIKADDRLTDCGAIMYHPHQPDVFSGGSGGACCSLVTFGYLLSKIQSGDWKRILVSATGALLSSISAQQKDTIPCISHAIVFERKD